MDPDKCLSAVLLASSKVLGHPVQPGQSFLAAGGDSLLAVELLIALEAALSIEIDEDALFATRSFGELADRILADAGRGGG